MALEELRKDLASGETLLSILAELKRITGSFPIQSNSSPSLSTQQPLERTITGALSVGKSVTDLSNGGTQYPVTAPSGGSFSILGIGNGGTPAIELGATPIALSTSPIAAGVIFLVQFPCASGWSISSVTGVTVLGVFFIEGD